MRHFRVTLWSCLLLSASGCTDDATADTDGGSSSSSTSGTTAADESSSTGPACPDLVLELGDAPCVQFGQNEITDFIDDCGFALSCTPREGPNDGRMPDGLSVRPDCAFQGSINEDRIGGWAQIVDVERDGESIAVPFCAIQEQSLIGGYSVDFAPSPVLAKSFDPAAGVSLEDESPTLRIRPSAACPFADCGFSLAFDVLNAGFSPSSVTGLGELEDDGGNAVLVQPLTAAEDMLDPEFTTEPWVFAIEYNYCMQPGDACSMINPNTDAMDAFSAFAAIMLPQQ